MKQLEGSVEAILFAGGDPVPVQRISEALEVDEETVHLLASRVSDRLADRGSALEVIRLEDAYQLTARPEYAECVRKTLEQKEEHPPLSQAAMEVLSVIAYHQPVTRAYIEQVRGVDCSGVVSSLCAKGLIEEQGRMELPGRPLLYGTTTAFLRCFGLHSLQDLPLCPTGGSIARGRNKADPPHGAAAAGGRNALKQRNAAVRIRWRLSGIPLANIRVRVFPSRCVPPVWARSKTVCRIFRRRAD